MGFSQREWLPERRRGLKLNRYSRFRSLKEMLGDKEYEFLIYLMKSNKKNGGRNRRGIR